MLAADYGFTFGIRGYGLWGLVPAWDPGLPHVGSGVACIPGCRLWGHIWHPYRSAEGGAEHPSCRVRGCAAYRIGHVAPRGTVHGACTTCHPKTTHTVVTVLTAMYHCTPVLVAWWSLPNWSPLKFIPHAQTPESAFHLAPLKSASSAKPLSCPSPTA